MLDRTISKSIEVVETHGFKKGGKILAVVGGLALMVGGGIYWLQSRKKTKEIKENRNAKVVIDKFKTNNEIILDKAKTDNDIRENSAAADDKIRIMKAHADERIRVAETKEKLYASRNNRGDETNPTNGEATTIPPSYDEILQQNQDLNIEKLSINDSGLFWYDIVGIAGLNHGGKSTLIRQMASSFSTGHQEAKLFPNWKNSSGVCVLLFALEHNESHFIAYDANQHKSYPNLRIETNVSSISQIKDVINHTAAAYPNGLIVIIDNYTKLRGMVKTKPTIAMGNLGNWMDDLVKKRFKERKPITFINVFHTVKGYDGTSPMELSDVAGDANYTRFCQGFIGLSVCKYGEKYRVFKVLKNKYQETPTSISVLRYADSPIWMFEHVEEAEENEVLPTKSDVAIKDTSSRPESVKKRGRRTDMSLSEAISYWDKVHRKETTWAEIEKATGKTEQAIKKRCKRNGYSPEKP